MINKRLKAAFDKYIEEENKPKTYGTYGSSYNPMANYNANMYGISIFFYEWSNLRIGAKNFIKKEEFFKYLDDCKIEYTEAQKKEIDDVRYCNIFATCVPNKAQLMFQKTWHALNTAVNDYKTANSIPFN